MCDQNKLNAITLTEMQIRVLKVLIRYQKECWYSASTDEIRTTMRMKSHLSVTNAMRALLKKDTGMMSEDMYGSNNGVVFTINPKDRWDSRKWGIKDMDIVRRLLNEK